MGFSKPKAIAPAAAPPPATSTSAEVARAEEMTRMDQAGRRGSAWAQSNPGRTLLTAGKPPVRKRATLLTSANA